MAGEARPTCLVGCRSMLARGRNAFIVSFG